jgi:hypothetical protein
MLDLSRIDAYHKVTLSSPLVAPCPRCGRVASRSETRTRLFWEADLRLPTIREVRMGCYICDRCPKRQAWFCELPPDLRTHGQYTRPSVRLVVDLVKLRKMSAEAAATFAQEVLHLTKLDPTTIMGWVREEAEAGSRERHLEETLAVFSGQLALDELYDSGLCQLVATDPIANRQLDYELLDHPATEEDVRAFCKRLDAAGFRPELVVTDGSKLYPPVIAEVWPTAEHQRCVFHFIKQLNEELGAAFWAAYATMPKPPKRKRGRPKKRGRPREDGRKLRNRDIVRDARYLFLARDTNLDEEQQAKLQQALDLCPALRILRRFVLAIHELFGPTTTSAAVAEKRRQAIRTDVAFTSTAGLEKGLGHLADDDLFARLTRYLGFENAEKTSNHVERENREYRKRQKGCYRLRSLRSIRALASLLRDRSRPRRVVTVLRRRPPAATAKEVSANH